jgi:putative Holliday junction resolvase
MRFLGVDLGRRRIGLALSDASGTLARPWTRVPAGATPDASAAAIAGAILRAADPLDEQASIGAIVLGLPRRLGGEDNDMTPHVREVAALLRQRTGLAVHLQDERLTSAEAESRLAEREKDWRRRKGDIDAVAASIILQDFLDSRPPLPPA